MYNTIQHILDSQQLTLNMAYQDIYCTLNQHVCT